MANSCICITQISLLVCSVLKDWKRDEMKYEWEIHKPVYGLLYIKYKLVSWYAILKKWKKTCHVSVLLKIGFQVCYQERLKRIWMADSCICRRNIGLHVYYCEWVEKYYEWQIHISVLHKLVCKYVILNYRKRDFIKYHLCKLQTFKDFLLLPGLKFW